MLLQGLHDLRIAVKIKDKFKGYHTNWNLTYLSKTYKQPNLDHAGIQLH